MSVEQEWDEKEIERLRRLWTETKPDGDGWRFTTEKIGHHMDGRSKNSVVSKANRMREVEGEERWPRRGSPIIRVKSGSSEPTVKPGRRRRLPSGVSTLPPLESAS